MALIAGTRLGPYEVTAQIGAGGMGEVYRATDTNLKRSVAIKVLPASVAADADRLARFQREAEVLASLNHAHIAQIHGLEKSDGITALVMELIEGPTLADRIAQGAIPLDEALPIAKQIAEALEAAHEQGIIHRDLKPANIKVRPDGTVKVLDFGLAKAVEPVSAVSPNISQSPTIVTPAKTQMGLVLGTAAYMSPEQARGKPVDKRADIWAFGAVLYEMLSSRASFAGNTISDTIAAVLERAPDWSRLPTTTPPTVRRLLQRCLDKDLRRRLQHIGDARTEIEDILNGTALNSGGSAVADRSRPPVRLARSIAVIASLVALLAVGALTWYLRTERQEQTTLTRALRLTMASSGPTGVAGYGTLAITPDGGRVVYVGNDPRQLFVRPLDQLDATAILTSAAPLNFVCVSPDGEWIGFLEGRTLKKVAITGGPPVTLATAVGSGGATWALGDAIIFAGSDRTVGLQRVSAAGGAVTVLTRPAQERGEVDHLWPEALPGGQAVLYTIEAASGGLEAAQVAVLDLATGTSKVVVRGGRHAKYLASGHLVYVAGRTLRAIPFDPALLETRGTPVTVLPRLVTSQEGLGAFASAADGTLAYVDADDTAAASTMVWVDRQGREESVGAPPHFYRQPRVSPDGTLVAVGIAERERDLWIWDLARRTLSRRTFDPANDFFPVWMPDGRRLIYASQRPSVPTLFWRPADGTGGDEPLRTEFPSDMASNPSGWNPTGVTPDGAHVVFSNGVLGDLLLLTLDETRRVQPLIRTPAVERNGVLSPDGNWLAYESDSSGRFEVYVQPFPNVSAGQSSISTAGGAYPVWARNGKELFYVAPDNAVMAVQVDVRGGVWSAGSPTKVVAGSYATQGTRNYDVSRDGRRFLMIKQPPAIAPQIVVVQNWHDELKRLVPTN